MEDLDVLSEIKVYSEGLACYVLLAVKYICGENNGM